MSKKYIMTASNISLDNMKQNRRHMTVGMRMFSTKQNLNGVAVTEAFIDHIIANKQDYVGMPLCADVKKQKSGDYRGLGHMFDGKTNKYYAEQIGSFIDLEKTIDEHGVSLFGIARVNKRSDEVCNGIIELYNQDKLSFSFEIEAEEIKVDDGVIIVDAADGNDLMAMAVVYYPAFPEAKATTLVAEANKDKDISLVFAAAETIYNAEIDFATIRGMLWDILYDVLGEESWYVRTLLVCVDCMIFYSENTGQTFKVEYRVEENGITVTDWYEVNFTRAERGENEMTDEQKLVTAETDVVVDNAETKETIAGEVETTIVEIPAEEQVDVNVDDTIVVAENSDKDASYEAQIIELKATIATLTEFKKKYEAMEAEKIKSEQDAKKEKLMTVARSSGLDVEVEEIKAAIESLNSDYIIAEIAKLQAEEPKKESKQTVRISSDITIEDKFGNLLTRSGK